VDENLSFFCYFQVRFQQNLQEDLTRLYFLDDLDKIKDQFAKAA
jgi:hypothetical protein